MAYNTKRKYRRRPLRKSPSKKTVVRKALRKSNNQRVAKVCKKVISNMAEVKSSQTTYTVSLRNAQDTVSNFILNNVIMVSPNTDINPIIQGTNSEQRTGNKIRTKYCKGKIILYPNPSSAVSNINPKPCIIRFYCVSPKDGYYSASEMATVFDTSFYQDGNTTAGYSGTLVDLISTVNKDILTLHWTRTYKLGHATMANSSVSSSQVPLQEAQWSNNDYKMNHIINFDFTKHVQKNFTFNDNASTPQGKSTFLIAEMCYADGRPFTSASSELPVGMYYQIDYGFTDM